ncbi:MAG: dihydrofolate reductase family protein [Acidimicrobiales bacterium]
MQIWGSGKLLQTLLQHELVDLYRLMTFPVVLGSCPPLVQRRNPPGDDAPCRPHRYRSWHRPRHLRTNRSGSPRSDVKGGRTRGDGAGLVGPHRRAQHHVRFSPITSSIGTKERPQVGLVRATRPRPEFRALGRPRSSRLRATRMRALTPPGQESIADGRSRRQTSVATRSPAE